jgi:hypothetical protein
MAVAFISQPAEHAWKYIYISDEDEIFVDRGHMNIISYHMG